MGLTFLNILQKQANEIPQQETFLFFNDFFDIDGQLTFASLDHAARKIAAALQRVTAIGDRVLIISSPTVEYMMALFGCFYAGVVAVPVYPPNKKNELLGVTQIKNTAAAAQVKVALVNYIDPLCQFDGVAQLEILSLLENNFVWREPDINADHLAIILFTSGSTGNPKGVMLSHGNLIYNMQLMAHHCQRSSKDLICIWLPHCHIAGIYLRLLAILLGTKAITLTPQKFLEQPLIWLRLISHYKATICAAPNFAYDLCSQHEVPLDMPLDLSSLTMAISGGEMVRGPTLDRFTDKFFPFGFRRQAFHPYYGLTETLCTTVPARGNPEKLVISRESLKIHLVVEQVNDDDAIELIGNGQPFADTVAIVNPNTLLQCSPDQIGEIWVSGKSVTSGYWNNPLATKELCHAYIVDTQQGPFCRTGDLGFFYNKDLYITGRHKELIIIRGKNYYPEDIEKIVLKCDSQSVIAACAAFSADIQNQEVLIVAVELKDVIDAMNSHSLVANIQKEISYQIGLHVHAFIFVKPSEFPRTATGKIKRSTCREKYLNGEWIPFNKSPEVHDTLSSLEELNNFDKDMLLSSVYMNDNNLLKSFLLSLFTQQCGPMNLDQPIADLGIDSVKAVFLMIKIRKTFDITLPYSVFYEEMTLSDLAETIKKMVQGNKTTVHIEYTDELKRLKEIIPKKLPPLSFETKNIFLTGGTGFLGGFLLADLLNTAESNIYCLLRGRTISEAKKRIQSTLSTTGQWDDSFSDRIFPILGDLSKTNFGLTDDDFSLLAEKIDLIIHNGADVNFVASYKALKNINVNSIFDIIKLSTCKKLKPVHFVSTLAVFNAPERYQHPLLKESDSLDTPDNLFSGYAQCKWVVEKILNAAKGGGIPITIYRPGLITGDSHSGFSHTDDFLCRFIKGCLQKGLFPDVDVELDMIPVDYVSKAIIGLIMNQASRNKVFHLTNPHPYSLSKLVIWLKNYGYGCQMISLDKWTEEMKNHLDATNALYPLLPFLVDSHPNYNKTILEMFNGKKLNHDNANVAQLLPDLKCQEISDILLETYVDFFIKKGFFEGVLKLRSKHYAKKSF